MLKKLMIISILIITAILAGCGSNFQSTAEKKAVEFVKIYEKIYNGDMSDQTARQFLMAFVPAQRDLMAAHLQMLHQAGHTVHREGLSMVFVTDNVITNYVKDIPGEKLQEASITVNIIIKGTDRSGVTSESKGKIDFIIVGKDDQVAIYDWREES